MNVRRSFTLAVGFSAAWTLADPLPVDAAPLALQNATATHSQVDITGTFHASKIIDGDLSGANGWAILPQSGQNNTAVFETQSDIGFVAGSAFTFTFQQLFMHPAFSPAASVQHTMGRFRLSVTTDDRSTFADGLQSGGDVTATWTVLDPLTFTSQNGATLTEQPDTSILASGFSPGNDVYNVTATTNVVGITGIRLEMLADPSLPQNGPGRRTENGNFVLTEMTGDVVAVPAAGVPGDYNNNGAVDAADYVLWRKGGPLANEVDNPGTVNAADYTEWRSRFGNPGSGTGVAAGGSPALSGTGEPPVPTAAVPEPGALALLLLGVLLPVAMRRKGKGKGGIKGVRTGSVENHGC